MIFKGKREIRHTLEIKEIPDVVNGHEIIYTDNLISIYGKTTNEAFCCALITVFLTQGPIEMVHYLIDKDIQYIQ